MTKERIGDELRYVVNNVNYCVVTVFRESAENAKCDSLADKIEHLIDNGAINVSNG